MARALLFCLFLLSLGACGDQLVVGSDVLWSARFETGDFSEWTLARGATGVSPNTNRLEPSHELAHGGNTAAKLTLTTTSDGTQASAVLTRGAGLPATGYYSAWYLLPSPVTVSSYWVIFKLRVRTSANDESSETELYDVNLTNLPGGEMGLRLYDHRSAADVPLEVATPTVPIGRWFQLEAFYVNADDGRGRLTLWRDGERLVDVTNKPMANNPWVGWHVGSVALALNPASAVLFVDDCAVSASRVGPTGALVAP